MYYICSGQFANLHDFELALRKLEIVKLKTNFKSVQSLGTFLKLRRNLPSLSVHEVSPLSIPNNRNHFFTTMSINEETYVM